MKPAKIIHTAALLYFGFWALSIAIGRASKVQV